MKIIYKFVFGGCILISCNNPIKEIYPDNNSNINSQTTESIIQKDELQSIKESDLFNTTWFFKFDDTGRDFFKFDNKNNFILYSCEASDTIFGTFCVINDTLITESKYSSSDKYLSKTSEHRSIPIRRKYVLKQDRLIPSGSYRKKPGENFWEKIDFQSDPEYVYTKE